MPQKADAVSKTATKRKGKPKAIGRPSRYSPAIARAICKLLAQGWPLTQICRQPGFPNYSTVTNWALDDREGFYQQYARAREIGYQRMADEIVEISDDGRNDWEERETRGGSYIALNKEATERSKLRVDSRKWLMSKALPKIYGDKLDVKHDASDDFRKIWAGLTSAAQAAA